MICVDPGDFTRRPHIHGLDWAAKVVLTGPIDKNINPVLQLGVSSIQVGFVQHVQVPVMIAYGQEETYLISSMVSDNWVLDLSNNDSAPWYAMGRGVSGPSMVTGTNGTIYADDTPVTTFPVKVQVGNTTFLASDIREIENFSLDVAASTTAALVPDKGQMVANSAWKQYTAVGGGAGISWSLEYQGSININPATGGYNLTLGDSPGVIPPTEWKAFSGPHAEEVTSATNQTLLAKMSWNGNV